MAEMDGERIPAKVSCARNKESGHTRLYHVAPGLGRVKTVEIPGRMVMWRVRRPRLRWQHVVDIYEGGTPAILTYPEVNECGKVGKCQVACRSRLWLGGSDWRRWWR